MAYSGCNSEQRKLFQDAFIAVVNQQHTTATAHNGWNAKINSEPMLHYCNPTRYMR